MSLKPRVGDRIRMVGLLPFGDSKPGEFDPSSPPVGATGTVTWVNQWTHGLTKQFSVAFDDGVIGPPSLLAEDPYVLIDIDRDSLDVRCSCNPDWNWMCKLHGMND